VQSGCTVGILKRVAIAAVGYVLLISALPILDAQSDSPEITGISPTSGPEGSRIEITGRNLRNASAVLFASTLSDFKVQSRDHLIVLVPHKVSIATITVIALHGRATSPVAFIVTNDPRIPDEVSYKAGYVSPTPPPTDFHSALLWGIAIADTRVAGYESAQVEIAWTQLSCRIDGKAVILNDDSGNVRGGLYRREPWFGTDQHEPMPLTYNRPKYDRPKDDGPKNDQPNRAVVLRVGQRPDRVWHFWSASPRAALPTGQLEGCTVRARVKISSGALLQMGMDYWRSPTVLYGPGGNNHEAGASNWYFPSAEWQEAIFTDIGGPQF
jgi:hypothetical protein